jgi:hypothetical protein
LDDTDFGIICVTRSNQHEPWLVFEAGALAKHLEVARVVPLCIDLAPAGLTGPLAAFQGRTMDKDGMKRLVHDVSEASEKPMPRERVGKIFEALWPDFQRAVIEAVERLPVPEEPDRSADDMLAEIVDRVRRIERDLRASPLRLVGQQLGTGIGEVVRRSEGSYSRGTWVRPSGDGGVDLLVAFPAKEDPTSEPGRESEAERPSSTDE